MAYSQPSDERSWPTEVSGVPDGGLEPRRVRRFDFGGGVLPKKAEPLSEEGVRGRRLPWWVTCALSFLGLLLMLGPPIYQLARTAGEDMTREAWGLWLCGGLLSQSLPPVNEPLRFGTLDGGETTAEADTGEAPAESEASDETETSTPSETEPDEPDEVPILSVDISQWEKGAGYIRKDFDGELPEAADGWSLPSDCVVLVVHSHPYETYGDGGDTARQGAHGWAVEVPTDGGYPADGVVALGERLTLLLRLRGVNVIHAVLPSGESPSHMDTYERTADMVTALLEAHPKIGLVIDLRRSAEQTSEGALLRTHGTYEGQMVAQIGITVSADPSGTAWHEDLLGAVTLRRLLYGREKTLCAPVTVTSGRGMGAGQGAPRGALLWTVTLGSAGNTYEEAAALLVPLAEALTDIFEIS